MLKNALLVLFVAIMLAAVPLQMAKADAPGRLEIPAAWIFEGTPHPCIAGEMLTNVTGKLLLIEKSAGAVTIFHISGLSQITAVGSLTGDTYLIAGALHEVTFEDGSWNFSHSGVMVVPASGVTYTFQHGCP